MSKILLLTLTFPPAHGGVGRMYYELCRAMPPGIAVVWTPPDQLTESTGEAESFTIRRKSILARRGPFRWVKTIPTLYAYLEAHDIDNVIVGQVLPLGIAVWLLAMVRPFRYAVFVHGMDVTTACKVARRRWIMRRVLQNAAAVFATNRYIAKVTAELGVPPDRIRLIYPPLVLQRLPNAATVIELRARENITHHPILITIARLVERKGHAVVLQALEEVWKVIPEVRYYIIGQGPAEARLRGLAEHLSRPRQVYFLGELSDELTSAWLSLATIFIMTPRQLLNGDVEGFGIVYLEAGYLRKAVIGSRSGGVPEAVIDQVTGFLVPENDPPATAAAIIQLLRDEALRERLGQAGHERALRFQARTGAETILRTFHAPHDD